MWTDEASGAYIAYSSIAEEGTSSRAHFNAKLQKLGIYKQRGMI